VELALNLFWAGLSATLLALWFTRLSAFGADRRFAVALLALLCVICVLFPVISMTDDLNASPAEPETVKSKLALMADFQVSDGTLLLVYDPYESRFHHQVEAQPDYLPPVHSYLSFLLTRRPPPAV